jgi:hypothetical protein
MGRRPSRPPDRRPSPTSARTATVLGGRAVPGRGRRRAGRAGSPGGDAAGPNPSSVPPHGRRTPSPAPHGRTGITGRSGQDAPGPPWPSTNRGHRGPTAPIGHRNRQHREAGPRRARSRPDHRVPASRRYVSSPDRWAGYDPPREAPEARPHLPAASPTKPPVNTPLGSNHRGENDRSALKIAMGKDNVKYGVIFSRTLGVSDPNRPFPVRRPARRSLDACSNMTPRMMK